MLLLLQQTHNYYNCSYTADTTSTSTSTTTTTNNVITLSEVQPKHKLLLLLPITVHCNEPLCMKNDHRTESPGEYCCKCTCFTLVHQTNMIPPTLAKPYIKYCATLLLYILCVQVVIIIQAIEPLLCKKTELYREATGR